VGSNPAARTKFLWSVPAEWSATSPENWDGYLIGRGFDSSALLQTRTAQTVRLPCLPAKQCVPACIRIMPEAVRHAVVAQGQSSAPVSRRSRFEPARRLQLRGSVTCGAQDAGCNPAASGALFDSAFPHQPMEDVMTRRDDDVPMATMNKRRHGF
jgi:hypothetical protein